MVTLTDSVMKKKEMIETDCFTVIGEEMEFWFFNLENAINFYNSFEDGIYKREIRINKSKVKYNPTDFDDFEIIYIGSEIKVKKNV